MAELRTIVIAPKTDLLLVQAEVSAVINRLGAQILDGEIDADDVLEKLDEQWDCIWFAAHGDENGIHLSKGVILTASRLTSFIRTAGASLVVFNTCSSYQVAQTIYNELLIDFVCTIRRIPDEEAFFTGKQFAIHLARGKTPHEAYLAAKTGGNLDYIFISKREQTGVSPPNAMLNLSEMAKMTEELRRLVELMDGNPRNEEPGLLREVKALKAAVAQLQTDLRFLKLGMWVMAGSSVLIALILLGVLINGGGA